VRGKEQFDPVTAHLFIVLLYSQVTGGFELAQAPLLAQTVSAQLPTTRDVPPA
jgi:hypothetical protein